MGGGGGETNVGYSLSPPPQSFSACSWPEIYSIVIVLTVINKGNNLRVSRDSYSAVSKI